MMIKTDLLGGLLTAQFLVALGGALLPKRFGRWLWRAVLPLGVCAIVLRWSAVGHPPMRNLFEAFLWLPPILILATLFSAWRDRLDTTRLDATLGALIAFPLAFVLSSAESQLPPALQSPFFVPHVLGYMLAYALLTRSFVLECWGQSLPARRNLAWGFCLLTTALALGSIWGNEAWGAYWQWDPKEQWSLATWLLYVALLHAPANRRLRLVLLGLGVLFIVLTVTWINLSKLFPGMHSYAGI